MLIWLGASSVQAQTLIREAVTSGGTHLNNGSYSLSISYGQSAISLLDITSNSLSQGFQQNDRNDCFADFNNDGIRNTGDLIFLLGEMGCISNCLTDLNGDGVVNTGDLNAILSIYGTPCP